MHTDVNIHAGGWEGTNKEQKGWWESNGAGDGQEALAGMRRPGSACPPHGHHVFGSQRRPGDMVSSA